MKIASKAVEIEIDTAAQVAASSAGSQAINSGNRDGIPSYPIPVIVQNDSASNVYIGGPEIDVAQGYKLAPGESVSFDLVENETLWAHNDGPEDPAVVRVLYFRQA